MNDKLEVYRELAFTGPVHRRTELRTALISAAVAPWSIDAERSRAIERSGGAESVLLFRREADLAVPAAGLTLWGTDSGYYVPNVVPVSAHRLTYREYNAVLDDFVERVAGPAARSHHFAIETTAPLQGLEDWMSPDAAAKLRTFSSCANKSTGAGHPMDERRWFAFLTACHLSGGRLDAGLLGRWLIEADGWGEEVAHRLACDFETGSALLAYYDRR